MDKIYIKTPQFQYGPLSPEDAKRLIQDGVSTAQDLIWDVKDNTWTRLGNYERFRPYFEELQSKKKRAKVVAFASGKGGVGKTALTASMAIELGKLGKKVVVVDADFGGPDLHEWMGVSRPSITLNSFFTYRNITFEHLLIDTPYKNVKLISGEVGNIAFSTPKFFKRLKFLRQLHTLDSDFVFVDLSPGVAYQTVDIFISCDEGIVITIPEPTSFMDSFNFIRSCLLRKLYKSLNFSDYSMKKLKEFENWDWVKYDKPLRPIFDKILMKDPRAGAVFMAVIQRFKPKIISNMVYNKLEARESSAFKGKLKQLLMIDVIYLGYIEFNPNMRRYTKEKRPFILSSLENANGEKIPQIKVNFSRT
ncbi:P-loop NTPase [candidate division KSB1 bacterium]|nr:P-loop NTPase [candidate division KSB1 bacterium]